MNRKRRGNNEGSIYQRKDGWWVAAVSGGYDETGRHLRRSVYGKSKAEVREKLLALQSQVKSAGRVKRPSVETLTSFLTAWVDHVVKPKVRETTYRSYEMTMRVHIFPHVGKVRLDEFRVADVRQLQRRVAATASPRTQRLVHTVLHSALKEAVRDERISLNPCGRELVDAPRYTPQQIRPLTTEQAQALLDAARGDRLEALYVLALTTGMRSGELFALHWEDVDLNVGSLSVRRSLQNINGKTLLVEPKTRAGKRRIDLASLAVAALREHRKRLLAEGLAASALVFPSSSGSPLQSRNVTRRSFEPLLAKAGLPRIRFHDLRHTFATTMLTQGVHPKVVQEMLGHSKIVVTLDTYSHCVPSMQKEAAARLDSIFSRMG